MSRYNLEKKPLPRKMKKKNKKKKKEKKKKKNGGFVRGREDTEIEEKKKGMIPARSGRRGGKMILKGGAENFRDGVVRRHRAERKMEVLLGPGV